MGAARMTRLVDKPMRIMARETMPELKAPQPELAPPPRSAAALLAWYDRHRRSLPWRALPGETADPYKVWLSEVMLQQTTVAAVKPYYLAFLERWPTVAALAAAPLDAVMQQWAGLGYYSRARNLHACAQAIVTEHGGDCPPNESALLRLPGIGPYTAAAIAAIAFQQKVAVVDGNVERVVARLCALEVPLPAAKPLIKEKVAALVPADRPGDFAQAMMDLGATICTPRRPACGLCPLGRFCRAAAQAAAERFPLKAPKPERPLARRRGLFHPLRRCRPDANAAAPRALGRDGGISRNRLECVFRSRESLARSARHRRLSQADAGRAPCLHAFCAPARRFGSRCRASDSGARRLPLGAARSARPRGLAERDA